MYTIVIADDEVELRSAIVRRINWEEIGFLVVGEAENGIEALELVDRLEPDLLLTDIRMPFISGIELARQVREVRPATQIAFLSGYDDFSYAQQAIQYNIISYLLKPITMAELTAELVQIKRRLDTIFAEFAQHRKENEGMEAFLLPLLMDPFQDSIEEKREERLYQKARELGLVQAAERVNRFVVLTVTLLDQEGNNRTESGHLHAVDMILEKYVRHRVFFAENRIVAVLIATPAAFEKYLHILGDDIFQSVKRILNLSCCIGVSRETARLSGLNEAHREAVNAMRYAGRTGGGIRYISDEEPFGGTDMDEVMRITALAEELLRAGDKSAMEELLDREFAQAGQEKTAGEKRSYLLLELLSTVCRVQYAVSDEKNETGLSGEMLAKQLTFLDRPFHEAAAHFKQFCLTAMDRIAQEKQRSSMDACDRALFIIRSEFADPELSLVSVGARIGVSPNYLSALIKKRTGMSFVDYLTRQRMEEAKQQLLESDKKIREIAEACGYSDQHYFSYCFKKFAGASPNVLRRQSAESGENA